MKVPANRPLADFLPTISILAKGFAAELTSVNVQTKDLHGETTITQEHIENNAAVRRILLERGVVPEDLPAEEDVKKVERRLANEEKKAIKNKDKIRYSYILFDIKPSCFGSGLFLFCTFWYKNACISRRTLNSPFL